MIDALTLLAAVGVACGSLFGLVSAVALVRFPDFYTRLHAAAKAGVVGTGFILLATAAVSLDFAVIIRALVAILFLLLTRPVSAHLLARSAYISGLRPKSLTKTLEASKVETVLPK